MYPRHSNPEKPGRVACAPYNFIPLPEKVITVDPEKLPYHDRYYPLLNSGYIDCLLITESPLYTRCALTPDFFRQWGETSFDKLPEEKRKEKAQFFHIDNAYQPVIPGSSLRGMVRSLIEIVSYGKVQWVADEPFITFRAVAASQDDPLAEPYRKLIGKFGRNVKAGYLKKRAKGWFIQPAKQPSSFKWPERNSFLSIKEERIPKGVIPGLIRFNDPRYIPQYHSVTFDIKVTQGRVKATRIGDEGAGYPYRGMLICTGNMRETGGGEASRRKNHFIILEPEEEASELFIPETVVNNYRRSLTEFQKKEPFDENYGCLNNGAPVFYITAADGTVLWLGHCPNFRVPAIYGEKDQVANPWAFVPEPLRSSPEPDLAEAIFGFTADKDRIHHKNGYAGRVFFTDAKMVSAEDGVFYSDEPITPKVLASPKPTCFQHYLVQDRAKGHDPDNKAKLAYYGTPTPSETVIRGHKLYWHKGKVDLSEIVNDRDVSESQLTLIRPVKPGVTFRFRVYFENLNRVELGALLWALNLPENCRHKLGMGKPLGLGTVKIKPSLFMTDRKERYSRLFDENNEWHEASKKLDDFRNYIQEFENFILEQVCEGSDRVEKLSDLARINMLLKMLQWPGPPKASTRYMEIKGSKENEYRERPVLPDPLHIKECDSFPTEKPQKKKQNHQGQEKINRPALSPGHTGLGTAMAEAFEKAKKQKERGKGTR